MTNPNQKIITVNKEKCNKDNLYATINLEAMELAAQDLDAGAFKLWIYLAKNQNGYTFGLSNKDAEATFGLKIRQYNTAVKALVDKGYLVNISGQKFRFNEVAVNTKCNNEAIQENSVITKRNNAVDTKCNNGVITKCNNALIQNVIRNITDNTYNTTINNTGSESASRFVSNQEQEEREEAIIDAFAKEWGVGLTDKMKAEARALGF